MLRYFFALTLVAAMMAACTPAAPQGGGSAEVQMTPVVAEEATEAATGEATEEATEESAEEATPVATEEASEETSEAASEAEFTMRDLGVELANPLALVYGPDDHLWLTERTGKRVVRVNPEDGTVEIALELTEAFQSAAQDGVLGLALHPEFLQDSDNDYVYLAYTYQGEGGTTTRPNRRVKIVRYSFDDANGMLGEPLELISNLSGSGDHNSGKLVIGPDEKLYYSHGDQGNNQFANACLPILAQVLPTQTEVDGEDWRNYPGKVLRMNLDGAIPDDNPTFEGVQSHIFTYGHRNVQGIAFGADGTLYATEQGPKTDDEINLLEAGMNYGWPHVAGLQDDQAYVYGNWSAADDCATLEFSDFEIPASVPQEAESAWSHPDFAPPLYTFGTVPDDYNFRSPECEPQEWICWPTIAPTGMMVYDAPEDGVPGWENSLLATALKTGTVYRLPLGEDGRTVGEPIAYFETTNRYRDVVMAPDGRTFYVITDSANWTLGTDGIPTNELENPGTILEFTYSGE